MSLTASFGNAIEQSGKGKLCHSNIPEKVSLSKKLLTMGCRLVFCLLLCCGHCFAQNSFRKNTVYAEFGGNGIDWSANYERQLGKKPGTGVRAGIGYASSTEEFRVSIPIGVNYLFDISHQRSFIETGIGVTWAEKNIWKTTFQNATSTYEPGYFASAGYRHQAPYGLMWRIDYTPFFTRHRIDPVFIGLSAGWSF